MGHAAKWAWDTVNKCVVENEKIDNITVFPLELNTMPGFAGSSAYYLRYMDPHNNQALVDKKTDEYWHNVDLYVGGTEHATGHLIYSRFWNKFLYDLGISVAEEPFQKLVNQGMIQGRSNFVYRIKDTNTFVSLNLKDQYDTTPLHVDVNIVSNDVLDLEAFKAWRPEYETAEFILEDGKYICGWAVEKMSKSMFNVVNPDMIVDKYGADTLRMYEMFLGPVEQSKPWDTNGIDGVHRFIKKFWSLFYDRNDNYLVTDEPATKEELKSLHKLIKKVTGRHRAILLQHKYQCLYDLCKRVVRNEMQQEGNPEPVHHRTGSLRSARMRRVVGDTGQCRLRMRCQVADMQRRIPGGRYGQLHHFLQRKGTVQHGVPGRCGIGCHPDCCIGRRTL